MINILELENFHARYKGKYIKAVSMDKQTELWNFLTLPETLLDMVKMVEYGRPPMIVVLEDIDRILDNKLAESVFLRHYAGALVVSVMELFGHEQLASKRMPNDISGIMKSASTFKYVNGTAKYRLDVKVEIKEISEEQHHVKWVEF